MLTGSIFWMIITTAQKTKFFVEDFFRKCDQIRRKQVTFTEEILDRKLHFLCSELQKLHQKVF